MSDEPVRYRLQQSFRYDYDAPASSLLHRLVVVPPRSHGDQRLQRGVVRVSDPGAQVSWERDGHGNSVCLVRLREVPRRLELHVEVVVRRHGEPVPLPREVLHDPRLLSPSLLTRADPAVARLARDVAATPDPLAAAEQVCRRVPQLVRYAPGSTGVRTTAAQALAGGRGVCQDQAHLMLAVLRAAGVPCRYVSGHMLGQGGTHAWVEVLLADGRDARAVALDPCHGGPTDDRYVTVATGRDYSDVPPTSGWYSGPGRGVLSGSRDLSVERAAA